MLGGLPPGSIHNVQVYAYEGQELVHKSAVAVLVLVGQCQRRRPWPIARLQPQRWQLSEDPDDRKDSLWIWGLFKEPLYPFILFSLGVCSGSELALADGSRLFLQCTHKGDGGLTALTTGDVSIRVPTEQNADLVGLSQFTYQEPVPFGSARFL